MTDKKSTEVAVIGGGPGGYAAAFMAADLGLEVTLIDPEKNPGGVCLYRGCIPSKALLHAARTLSEAEEAANWGITFTRPRINLKKLRSWKEDVVTQLTGGLGGLTKQRRIEHIRGTAKLAGPTKLVINDNDSQEVELKFEHAILAPGSRPATIPSLDLDTPAVLDSTSALDVKNIPKSLLVIGGGYIGLELGTVYAALGSKVSVVEMTPGLLPGVDRDLVSVLQKRLDSLFDSILLNTTVTAMKKQKNGVRVTLKSKNGDTGNKIFEKVLVAVGRRPNSENLGLENTDIETNDRGFIVVDSKLRTAEKNIYAIGDVVGEPMLAHKATHEGRVAAEVISGKDVVFEPQAIPAVVFTDPEIAWCGVTQQQAKERGLEVETARFPWAASGRALTLGRTDGLTKMIVDKKTQRVIGVGLVGVGAGELIAEAVLAMETGSVAGDIGLSIHPHPTLSETLMEAADLIEGTSTHYYRPKKK
jgi:dihydrolipoamide dehydrogenase